MATSPNLLLAYMRNTAEPRIVQQLHLAGSLVEPALHESIPLSSKLIKHAIDMHRISLLLSRATKCDLGLISPQIDLNAACEAKGACHGHSEVGATAAELYHP